MIAVASLMTSQRDDFELGAITALFLLDRRGDELLEPLSDPGAKARRLAAALSHEERAERAKTLATSAARLVRALEERRLK